ncbi:MAG: endolytic transglycosylase MltG [Patescibacteria group bacterium]|nr:endolytic transglycosylase MltG [Patescibacteria group bacterium]
MKLLTRLFILFVLVAAFTGAVVLRGVWGRLRAVKTVYVTIPEGATVNDINKKLTASGVLSSGEILPVSKEGYLFPDTYQFYVPSSPQVVEEKFMSNFDNKVTPLIPPKDDLKRIIIIASLIQDEAKTPGDMKLVSGVIWKRLTAGMPLQIDATVCYVKQKLPCLPITKADLEINSPYNTYLNKGLPPGPIGNPGLDAINAAVNPEKSSYWYYISIPGSGKLVFAETLDEQDRNIVKYLK